MWETKKEKKKKKKKKDIVNRNERSLDCSLSLVLIASINCVDAWSIISYFSFPFASNYKTSVSNNFIDHFFFSFSQLHMRTAVSCGKLRLNVDNYPIFKRSDSTFFFLSSSSSSPPLHLTIKTFSFFPLCVE